MHSVGLTGKREGGKGGERQGKKLVRDEAAEAP